MGLPGPHAQGATFDRARLSHAVNLYEMNAKYADVMTVGDIAKWLKGPTAA